MTVAIWENDVCVDFCMSVFCRLTMAATYCILVMFIGLTAAACGQSCLPEVNPHSYCSTDKCAPEDRLVGNPIEDCRTKEVFENDHVLPEEWELMFDSYDYLDLLGSVFLVLEFDNDNETVTRVSLTNIARNLSCESNFDDFLCSKNHGPSEVVPAKMIQEPVPGKWAHKTTGCSQNTSNILQGSTTVGGGYPTEVYLNITYRFTQCNQGCTNNFVTLYRYDTNSIASVSDRTNNSNYLPTPLFGQGTENTDSRFQQVGNLDVNVVRSFTTVGSTGFHLGIRDTGTCGQVRRIFLYYTPCTKKPQDGLVSYPELVRPPEGSPPNVAEACCAPNSHNTTSLSFRAYSASDGRCERSVRCECDAGYKLNGAICEGIKY